MKVLILFFLLFSNLASADNTKLLKRIDDLEKRLSTVEADSQLDIFSFGAYLSAGRESIDLEGSQINLDRLVTDFHIRANVSDDLKFYSTLSASKYFNLVEEQRFTERVSNTSLYSSNLFDDNRIQLTRAYFDYFFNLGVDFALSVGRLPTQKGPPGHFREDLPRQGTYPLMGYSVDADGFALTADLSTLVPENHELFLRAVYSPFSAINYNNSIEPLTQPTGLNSTKDTSQDVYSFLAEYNFRSSSFFQDSSSIFAYSKWQNGSLADVIVAAIPTVPTAESTLVSHPKNMFDIEFFTIYQELTNLFQWNLDFSVSYLITRIDTKRTATSSLSGTPVSLGFRNDGTGVNTAGILLVTLLKRLPIKALKNPSIGFEFLDGEKDSLTPNEFSRIDDETGFYGTMGKAYHVYWLQPVDDNITFRIGYRHQDQEFAPDATTQANLGSSQRNEQTIRTTYARFIMAF